MRSDTVTKGMQQAPHRSLFQCTGTDGGGAAEAIGRSCKFL